MRNGNTNLITKLEQVQVLHNNYKYPNNRIKSNPTHDDSDSTSSNCNHNRPCNLKDFSFINDHKFMHDPGRNNVNVKDGSWCSNSNSNSSSSSSNSTSCTTMTNTHHSYNCDCDKTIATPSNTDTVPLIGFVQAIPVPDITSLCSTNNPPSIPPANAAQHHHLARAPP